jgi:hypothetical protein
MNGSSAEIGLKAIQFHAGKGTRACREEKITSRIEEDAG